MIEQVGSLAADLEVDAFLETNRFDQGNRHRLGAWTNDVADRSVSEATDVVSGRRKCRRIQPIGPSSDGRVQPNTGNDIRSRITYQIFKVCALRIYTRDRGGQEWTRLKQQKAGQFPAANDSVHRSVR